jgi:hypothetical protein
MANRRSTAALMPARNAGLRGFSNSTPDLFKARPRAYGSPPLRTVEGESLRLTREHQTVAREGSRLAREDQTVAREGLRLALEPQTVACEG